LRLARTSARALPSCSTAGRPPSPSALRDMLVGRAGGSGGGGVSLGFGGGFPQYMYLSVFECIGGVLEVYSAERSNTNEYTT
jgi:hypothetical protein